MKMQMKSCESDPDRTTEHNTEQDLTHHCQNHEHISGGKHVCNWLEDCHSKTTAKENWTATDMLILQASF